MNKQQNRLSSPTWGKTIDRNRPLKFTFDGKTYTGYQGDTLASALLANNVVLMGRSFKYHRPRGVVTANSTEPNALMEINDKNGNRTPNTRATVIPITDGLNANSQNRFPSLKFDMMSINRYLSPFFVAGFYYKTFMGGGLKAWMQYEKVIRKAAGLGRADTKTDKSRYQNTHRYCDVLVIGGGVSGLTAALHHAEKGQTVILAEEKPRLGGRLNDSLNNQEQVLCEQLVSKITTDSAISVLTDTTVFGVYDGNVFGAIEQLNGQQYKACYYKIAAGEVVYATGAIERPLLFKNNDLPNVMLAEALQTYVLQYAVLPSKNVVFYTTNDSVYPLAMVLATTQSAKVTVVDTRPDSKLSQQAKDKGVVCLTDSRVIAATGRQRIKTLKVKKGTLITTLPCGLLAMSGGFTPNVNLQCHLGHKPDYDAELDALVIADKQGITVGSAAGVWGLADKIASAKGLTDTAIKALRKNSINHDNRLDIYDIDDKAFVDFQHDVSNSDVALATREGYTSVEHTKRYTTLGMATEQGKLANFNALKLMSLAQNRPLAEVGTTTYRPPYTPVTMGAFAGARTGKKVKPTRRIPTDSLQQKAIYTAVGLWQRPEFYPTFDGETKAKAYIREAKNVRENVGLIDVSTLGKITVQGPDAAELVNRLYINGMKKLAVGKIRYGLMLREDGVPYDDGTALRISDNEYLLTTTTAHAGDVLAHIEHLLQVVWPDLRVMVNTATDQWATIAVAGPKSRKVLKKLFGDDVALDNDSLPFMTFKDFTHNGIDVRLARISFSGELGYEVMVGANYGENLWNALLEAGKEDNIQPYGTEAMGALRIEKGFVTHAEMDGRVTVHQLGMTGMLNQLKPDFIGRYYAQNRRTDTTGEPQLIGLQAVNKTDRLSPGYHLVNNDSLKAQDSQGWVSSATWSVALDESIALGFLRDGNQRMGETVYAVSPVDGKSIAMKVVSPQFYDPKGTHAGEKSNEYD